MNYAEAVEHLHALGPELPPAAAPSDSAIALPPRRKFELGHMRTLCETLGNPQGLVPSVLIAGTNGKGSTAATLASILNTSGYRTGLYTSPHLIRVNERIQISEAGVLTPISDEAFALCYTRVDEACEALVGSGKLPHLPSFFERLTAVAFLFFAEAAADIMVLEVGLGGRLDATNSVEPMISVITDIALDHQDYLGDTITEIAREKCGILREGGVLVTLPQHAEANQAIGVAATALSVRAISAAVHIPPAERNREEPEGIRLQDAAGMLPRNRYTLNLDDETEGGTLEVDSPLRGHHQQRNIALAISAALELRNQIGYISSAKCNRTGYKIANASIEAGIRNTVWPGRLEFVAPNLLLDVAHNPAGAWTLRGAISSLPAAQPRTLLFSCLRDKNLTEMSRILFPLFDGSSGDPLRAHDHIVLAPISNARASAVEDLVEAAQALDIPAHAAPHVRGALAQAQRITPPGGIVVVTGSVYLIGEVRELVLAQALVPA